METQRQFKTEDEAVQYAIESLKQIADLCEKLGISFWHGEEDKYDSIYIDVDGYGPTIERAEYDSLDLSLADWLRHHIERLQVNLDNKRRQYSSKPVVVEAVRWTGFNICEISDFTKDRSDISFSNECVIIPAKDNAEFIAHPGDWIVRGIQGDYYPCNNDVFHQLYEKVDEDAQC